jgi:hypothetical protein
MKTEEEIIWKLYINNKKTINESLQDLTKNVDSAVSKWRKYYEGIVRSVYIPYDIDVSDQYVEEVKSKIDQYGEIITTERRRGKLAVKVGFETYNDFKNFKNSVDESIVNIDGSEGDFDDLIKKYVKEVKQPHDVMSTSHGTLRLLWNKYGREKTEKRLKELGVL